MSIQEYASLIKQCKTLTQGRQLHSHLQDMGLDRETFIANHLVQMYGNCRSPREAQHVFDKIDPKNVYSWNMMMSVCIQNEDMHQARALFDHAPNRDVVTWNAMITAYARIGHLLEGKNMFERMPMHNSSSWNSMLGLCGKNKRLGEAKDFFDNAPQHSLISWHSLIAAYAQNGYIPGACMAFEKMPMRTVISWNTMLAAHLQNGDVEGAGALFKQMPEQDSISWNTMITAYAQSGHIQEARRVFHSMSEPSVSSWNALISGYIQNEDLTHARELFQEMVYRNPITWNTMIIAYAHRGHLEEAKCVYDSMPDPDLASSTSMLLAYACAGKLDEARNMFEGIPQKDTACWSAMMTVYAQNGLLDETLDLFRRRDLEGFPIDRSSFVVIIEACTSLDNVSVGRIVHDCIRESSVSIENALISMYGKCACVTEAEEVFDSMSERNVVSWNSMMTAYAQNGHSVDSLRLGYTMLQYGEQPDYITFINVLSACSHQGLWRDGRDWFISIKQDHGVDYTVEHYHCMIDMLSRAGLLKDAEVLIDLMPFKAEDVPWRTLLSGACMYRDVGVAARAYNQLVNLDLATTSEHVMLANIYKTQCNM